ncbi:division/cell wall cluster transcriptional repressor MraZ [Desulfurivibrio sp. D14AmB]|uniref:division/cell wall cluster transcriptional repressor MraZ n=1 Tax=Desulfurivibrio sp. D14AmB TaxID=3374370 RepID=UPI00376F4519
MAENSLRSPIYHFRGRSEHTMDEKGRLSIATRFREVLRQQYDERLMITPWNSCLKAYPLPQWEEMELKLLAEGKKQPHQIKLVRYMIGGVVECALDKQGRVLLPPNLRAESGLEKEVVVTGMINYFEIWDKATWEKINKPTGENFIEFEQTLLELGLF